MKKKITRKRINHSKVRFRDFFIMILMMVSLNWQDSHTQYLTDQGYRPYELDWAGRFTDVHTPLVDFEEPEVWTIHTEKHGEASFERSQEQMIWGSYTGKIRYSGDPEGASFILKPSKPIPISDAFSEIKLWVWNDYWVWKGDRGKPVAKLSMLLETNGGEPYEIYFSRELDWPEWYLLHVRLNEDQRNAFKSGGVLKAIRLSNCLLDEEENIYLDNLAFYSEKFAPIHFNPQPRPGIDLAQGQELGVHTADKRLPFPTNDKTMLPENLIEDFQNELIMEGNEYIFKYQGKDGTLEYRYLPENGNLGDVTATFKGKSEYTLKPLVGGGVRLASNENVENLLNRHGGYIAGKDSEAREPQRIEKLYCGIEKNTVVSRWKLSYEDRSVIVEFVFRIWQKSLVIDIHSIGGNVGEVSLGSIRGAKNPRLIEVPYWSGDNIGPERGRPAVLVMGKTKSPLFLSLFPDYYRTGSSRLYFKSGIEGDKVTCAGGTRYLPKTDQTRNDCHERIFLTLSPKFEEILPTIPNPPSPWRSEAAKYLFCHHGARDREEDFAHWKILTRYGMKNIAVTDHESGWRNSAESFTFRTIPSPDKGGDEGQREYARKMQELGIRYGLYNNYTDLAPVNSQWDENMVTRLPDGSWQTAWFRCYAPKSTRAVDIEPYVTSIIQDKFNLSTAYCDVHTAITPWMRVDFDARVPGAGTMLSQYYAYGQLMLHQQEVWNGPVYSEGGNHYFYAGLITGNKSEDRGYDLTNGAWLVDFDLRKLHPLGCDLGFSKRGTFAKETGGVLKDEDWDRYFAGTIAYGHAGMFFNFPGRLNTLTLRSYYMLQQLQSSYCNALVKDIRYSDSRGRLLEVSSAVASGNHERSQLKVEYDNGLLVWVNGHKSENWKIKSIILPPNGYYAHNQDKSLEVFSGLREGRRIDFVHSMEYDYVDGRGNWTETSRLASDGLFIVLKNDNGRLEAIPYETERFAIALDHPPLRIEALDLDKKEMGTAKWEQRNGFYYIEPVKGAISYMVYTK